MAGIPLPFLNGFYSKELFFDSTLTLQQNSSAFIDFFVQAIPILALIGSTFTFVYSMYLFFGVFIKKADTSVSLNKKPKEPPIGMIIAPTVLVFGVIIIGLVPNLFNRILLTHTAQSILPSAGVETINFWHGLSTPFIISIIFVVVGALLTYFKKYCEVTYDFLPGSRSFNNVYDQSLRIIDKSSRSITNYYMNGSVRTYISLILTSMVVVTFFFMYKTDGFAIDFSDLASITILEATVVIAIVLFSLFYTHLLSSQFFSL